MKVECLDYRQLPHQNPLFLDYLYQYDRVAPFYSGPAHQGLDQLKIRVDSVLGRSSSYPRQEMVEVLTAFNERVGAGAPVFRNIKKLASEDTVAVVTGHQVGLFGGPAFSVYKAVTAVLLTQMLEEEGYSAVPVFWLASDDSDFQEVRSTSFFDGSGGLFSVTYPDLSDDGSRMVGTITLDGVEDCLNDLEAGGPRGNFQAEIVESLGKHYSSKKSFREALGSWMTHLFGAYGLVLFDSLTADHNEVARSVFDVAIRKRREIVQALRERSKTLEGKGFVPQVNVDDTESLIFWAEDHRRFKLECRDGRYSSRRRPALEFGAQDLLDELDHRPPWPNVLLRPILQDHLLPTSVYVGGPSEVAYYAQVNAISSFWGKEMSVFPRVGITVLDPRTERLLGKYGLTVMDVLGQSPETTTRQILEGTGAGRVLDEFGRLEDALETSLKSLQSRLEGVDRTTAHMLDKAQAKMLYHLGRVQSRFVANRRTHESDLGRHIEHLYCRLYPTGRVQERVINFGQFLSEQGPGFVDRLMETVKPFCSSHQVLYLG